VSEPTPLEPDQVIQTALRLLPVPPHGETFWEDLGRALDGSLGVATSAAPAVLVSADRTDERRVPVPPEVVDDDALALVPAALRRRSNALVVAVAAAAVVLVVFAGSSLVRDGSGDERVDLAGAGDPPDASPELDALVDDAHPASATPVTLSDRNEAASSRAVSAWVDAVHSGDAGAAWAAMGPTSQQHFSSRAAFEAQLADMDRGFGAWSEVEPDDVLITPVGSGSEGTIAVVTLVGTTMTDGSEQRRAGAFPVRVLDGEAMLEPFALAGELELVVPLPSSDSNPSPAVDQGAALVVVVPEGVEAPVLRLDDGDAVVCGEADGTELRAMDDLSVGRCSYLPTGGITPGEHTLTVAFVGADGTSISAEALLFQAA